MVFKVELGAINTGLLSPQPMLPDLSGFPESTVELRPRPVHATLSKTCHMAISGSDSSPRKRFLFSHASIRGVWLPEFHEASKHMLR